MNSIPKVQEVTDAVHNITPLAAELIKLVQSPVGWVGLSIIFVWLVLNNDFQKLFDLLGRAKRIKLERLDHYVEKPELADADAVKVIRDLRDAHYFEIATKIYAEKKYREALITLHGSLSSNVSWADIRRALPALSVSAGGVIEIKKETLLENFVYGLNVVFGYFIVALALFCVVIALFYRGSGDQERLMFLLSAPFMMVFAALIFAQNLPAFSARKIRRGWDHRT